MSSFRSREIQPIPTSTNRVPYELPPLWKDVWNDLCRDAKFYQWAIRNPDFFFSLVKEMWTEDVVDRVTKRQKTSLQENGNRNGKQ